jgi:hypothetical protein
MAVALQVQASDYLKPGTERMEGTQLAPIIKTLLREPKGSHENFLLKAHPTIIQAPPTKPLFPKFPLPPNSDTLWIKPSINTSGGGDIQLISKP